MPRIGETEVQEKKEVGTAQTAQTIAGFPVSKILPFTGKDDLPRPKYVVKKNATGEEIRALVENGDVRFFVNSGKVVMVYRTEHGTARKLFCIIDDQKPGRKKPEAVALRKLLRERKIPGA